MSTHDFDIDSLAKYLHLSPDQVRKMADRDRLPGRKIGGTWKFSKQEIHLWLENKIGAANELELNDVDKVLNQYSTETDESLIANLMKEELIWTPMLARTKNSVIEKTCELASQFGALWMPKEMAEAIRKREALHPTALGNGVALLHPRRPQPSFFGESFIALGMTTTGIPFGGPRG
ncbi:MAG: PTS sugar transporter subunit IIA, partial [Planctomycetota bacterium]